jgi:4-alpha-glucanotransferase
VCSGPLSDLQRLLFFGQSKEKNEIRENPFEKAIEQMMITTTTHDDYPKYFDFF